MSVMFMEVTEKISLGDGTGTEKKGGWGCRNDSEFM